MPRDEFPPRREGWDFYSDSVAVTDYVAHRDRGTSRNSLIEEPYFLELVGDVSGLRCLDLGCGYGHYTETLARGGATVVGVDRSKLMISQARARNTAGEVSYLLADIGEVKFPDQSYDVVVSNLAFHYLRDPAHVFHRVFRWLRPGGRFVFSVEHPIFTASREEPQWCTADEARRHWIVSDYFDERDRWGYFGRRYHHTFATWLTYPLECGFRVTRVVEPQPSTRALATVPDLAEDLHRPLFLIVACAKTAGGHT